MKSIRMLCLITLYVCLNLCTAEGNDRTLWKFSSKSESLSRRLKSTELRNRRLLGIDALEDSIIEVNVSALSSIRSGDVFSFELPRSSNHYSKKAQKSGIETKQTCTMTKGNPMVPDSLLSKYPGIQMFRCLAATGEELSLTINANKIDGFSGVFFGKNRKTYYIDSAFGSSNQYIIYETSSVTSSRDPPFEESVLDNKEIKRLGSLKQASRGVTSKAYIFKIAVIANIEYSQYHGDTVESVLAAVSTLFSRVNGIYAREVGVFFKFVEDMDKLFCTSDQVDRECHDLGNDDGILDRTTDFLTTRGFPLEAYDIGHAVTTAKGGRAQRPALCTASKAVGTTGLRDPIGDKFSVEYVCHEIGHQLGASHTFRDCDGPDDHNLKVEVAVEPGSGSTIMSYAGICGENNIQPQHDPYFNSKSLVQIKTYVESVGGKNSCGEALMFERDLSDLSFQVASCSVPIGNYFQLDSDLDSSDDLFFSWDRVDTGYEDFFSTIEGKFRSWRPVSFTSRFFPNLYYLNFDETVQNIEKLPRIEKTMTFQFTSRSLYSNDALLETFGLNQMGDLVYKTADVSFVDEGRLDMQKPSSGDHFNEGDTVEIRWKSAGIGNSVKIYVAEMILEETSNFRYDLDVEEFEWTLLGEADMEDEETGVIMPSFKSLRSSEQISVNFMIRASSSDTEDNLCFFFDLVTGVTIEKAGSPTKAPSPTPPPTPQTNFPSRSPTVFPTFPVPTNFPLNSPTPYPTSFPTEFPTGLPTPSPTTFPTSFPTEFPTSLPTSFPTKFPTEFPTRAPTPFPTN